MTVKNIIFDLGGVILNIDFDRTAQAFRQLGCDHFDALFSMQHQDSLFNAYETGQISAAQFRATLREKLGISPTDQAFDAAWNAMILDLPKKRLDYIKTLGKDRRVFLFSNTNEIHLRRVFAVCDAQLGISTFEDYFEREYYSHILGMRKPDPAAFTVILRENNLRADETLFVDDSLPNVLGARQAGICGMHLTGGMTVFDTEDYLDKTRS